MSVRVKVFNEHSGTFFSIFSPTETVRTSATGNRQRRKSATVARSIGKEEACAAEMQISKQYRCEDSRRTASPRGGSKTVVRHVFLVFSIFLFLFTS